jgi:pimeloyl-ACP methyl ester carboxylesterase
LRRHAAGGRLPLSRTLARASLLAMLPLLLASSRAAAQVDFRPCGPPVGRECARVTVPVDRSGIVPGTISLLVTRLLATSGHSTGALIALAGGPGQAATPFLTSFAADAKPLLRTRDLLVFDQRGTGGSGRLSCPGLEQATSDSEMHTQEAACAAAIGPQRPFFTTRDSADDIEAVRQAIGVDRIALYGVSYGSKVALAYAKRYPEHVEMLILDSVVPLDAPIFGQDTFAAIPRVLRDICAGDCQGITRDPVAAHARAPPGQPPGSRHVR